MKDCLGRQVLLNDIVVIARRSGSRSWIARAKVVGTENIIGTDDYKIQLAGVYSDDSTHGRKYWYSGSHMALMTLGFSK